MNHERNAEEARTPPTPEEFIRVWQTSRTLREACARLHMKRAVAKVRAHRYRQRGVPLKRHEVDPPVECYPNWQELARYAASLVDSDGASGDVPADAPASRSAPAPA